MRRFRLGRGWWLRSRGRSVRRRPDDNPDGDWASGRGTLAEEATLLRLTARTALPLATALPARPNLRVRQPAGPGQEVTHRPPQARDQQGPVVRIKAPGWIDAETGKDRGQIFRHGNPEGRYSTSPSCRSFRLPHPPHETARQLGPECTRLARLTSVCIELALPFKLVRGDHQRAAGQAAPLEIVKQLGKSLVQALNHQVLLLNAARCISQPAPVRRVRLTCALPMSVSNGTPPGF